jgi:hypothetical protein
MPTSSIQEGGCTTPPRLPVSRLRDAKLPGISLASPLLLATAILVIAPLTYLGVMFGASFGVTAAEALSVQRFENAVAIAGVVVGASLALLGGGSFCAWLSQRLSRRAPRPPAQDERRG